MNNMQEISTEIKRRGVLSGILERIFFVQDDTLLMDHDYGSSFSLTLLSIYKRGLSDRDIT